MGILLHGHTIINHRGGVICVKTKDRTVYFPLDTTSLTSQHKLRVMHKGKEYGLLCNFYL